MNTKRNLLFVGLSICGLSAATLPAIATLSLYAPYDTNFNLTVGINPAPSNTNGSPGITTGFALNGMPAGGALDVPGSTNGLQYKRADSYFAGVGNGLLIGSNTFRLLFQPDFSGVETGPFGQRKVFFQAGSGLGTSDSFALYHADNPIHGVAAIFSMGGVSYPMYGLSNFNWSSSTWYYMAVSFDYTGAQFYFRPMTNNSVATLQSVSFGSSSNWVAGFLDAIPINVGIRNTASEGAQGNIDDLKVYSSEKWSSTDFSYDYAVIIPEPATTSLMLAGLGLIACARRFRKQPVENTASNHKGSSMKRTLVTVIAAGIGLLASQRPASATLSFYAPYETTTNLTVGTPAAPTDSLGTVNIVPGFAVNGTPGNAGDFRFGTNALAYGNVSSYFTGTTSSSVIGSNTFRVMFRPNFSGTNNPLRHAIFGVGTLNATDAFYLYNNDDMRGPAVTFAMNNSSFFTAGALTNFNWNSSTWYYMGVSFDSTGFTFYERPLTNGATAVTQTVSFGGVSNWGANMGAGAWTVQVGRRAPIFTTAPDGADGWIDDVKVFSSEKWSVNDFNFDYAVVVPEPSSVALLGFAAIGVQLLRKRLSKPSSNA